MQIFSHTPIMVEANVMCIMCCTWSTGYRWAVSHKWRDTRWMDRPQNKSCYVLDTFPTTQHNYIQKITSTHAQTKLPNEVLISSRWKHLDSSLGMKFQYRLSSMPVIESAIDEIDMQTPRPPLSSQNSYTMSHTNFNISCLSRCKFASCNAITDTSSRTDVVRLQSSNTNTLPMSKPNSISRPF